MIRPFTTLCLLAACGSGLYLYSEKHRTAMLDRQISDVIHQTEAARARIGLLRADWALMNEPGRLQEMAEKYLTLKPMAPAQFVQLTDLPGHLPAPVAENQAAGTTDDDDEDSATPAASATAQSAPPKLPEDTPPAADAPAANAAADLPDSATTKHAADAVAAPKQLARADQKARPSHHVAIASRAYAPPHDGMLARGAPLPLAAPQPVGASVYSAMARPLPAPAYRPPVVAAVPRYAPPYVGSALGGRGTLPPPVPYDAGAQ